MDLLVELDGENTSFARTEFITLLKKYFSSALFQELEKRFLLVKLKGIEDEVTIKKVKTVAQRVGLSRTITTLFFVSSRKDYLKSLEENSKEKKEDPFKRLSIFLQEKGQSSFSFGVSVHFICSKEERKIFYPEKDVVKGIKKKVGSIILERNMGKARVNLSSPDIVISIYLGKRIYTGVSFPCIQRKAFKERKVQNRPFFSPVSVEPKWARASLNLLNLEKGAVVYDPFCGTAGLLIEAGLLGYTPVGSDINEKMVRGSFLNMRHFGITNFILFQCDVRQAAENLSRRGIEVDAVVSDFPYGRASTLGKEEKEKLYNCAFSTISKILGRGKKALLIVPSKRDVEMATCHSLELVYTFPVYIHSTLTRYFSLYRRV